MKNIKLVLALIACLSATAFMVKAETAVIVNPANGNALSQADVAKIFLGKNKSLTAVNLAEGNATRDEFNEKVLGKSASQLKSYWSKLIFTGKGTPPDELGSDADVKAKVAGDAKAIGYVDAASVDGSVKVLFKI